MGSKLHPGLIVVLWAATATRAEDWPQLLGPSGNGVSTETGLLQKWPASGPRVLWEKAIGTGYGAPSVKGGLLVVHHRESQEEIVECLEAGSGASLWRHGDASHFIDPYGYNNGPRATPLIASNRCYTLGAEGKLTCLELQTGKEVWQRDTGSEWEVPPAFFGVGSSPIVEGPLLLVMVGGQPNAGMVALKAATGQTVWESVGQRNWEGVPMTGWPGEPAIHWQRSEKQASYSTPVAATIHGRRQILCLMRQGLVSLDPANGAVNFSFGFRARPSESVNAMDPVVVDDLIFLSSAYYKTGSVLLRVKPDDRGVEVVWRGTELELHWMTPVCVEGFFYGFSGRNEWDARFRCVDLRTGRIQWDLDQGWQRYSPVGPSVYGRGSMILADGKLIVLGEGGLLGLFKPNPKEPEEIARFQVPSLRQPCWAAPVLSGKRLYLRSENRLVCLDLARP